MACSFSIASTAVFALIRSTMILPSLLYILSASLLDNAGAGIPATASLAAAIFA